MSDQERREILERVSSGDLSPDAAADLLESLSRSTSTEVPRDETPIKGVRVAGTFRTLRIEGDPSVMTAVAEGAHRVKTENGIMIFDADLAEELSDDPQHTYVVFGPRQHQRHRRRRVRAQVDLGRGRRFSWEGGRAPVLSIRMNPDLPLEVQMAAGSARVSGIRGAILADLTAGSARFEGVRSPFQAEVDAGSVQVSGLFDRGESSIRCTAGKVGLTLEKGSSVRITAKTTMGKVLLPDDQRFTGFIGAGKREAVVGDGAGTLDLEATTGVLSVELA